MLVDPFELVPFDSIVSLIRAWARLLESRKQEERETDEWKKLEAAYVDHLRWRFNYPADVFGQQKVARWIVTFLDFLLVVAGLAYSFLQLHAAIRASDFSSLQTELSVETAGRVSISSSIVGAVVLVVSLLFFYLYLKHVFTIQHPVPPYVSFSKTDAALVWKKRAAEPKAQDAPAAEG